MTNEDFNKMYDVRELCMNVKVYARVQMHDCIYHCTINYIQIHYKIQRAFEILFLGEKGNSGYAVP